MGIREASSTDIPELCKLMFQLNQHEISPEDMQNRLHFVKESPFDYLYVYEEEGAIPGLLGFRIRENLEEVSRFGEISVIVVDAETRGKGIGRSLMDFAERLAQEHECMGTWLVSGLGREEEAHKFYKQLGYEITGYRFVKRK